MSLMTDIADAVVTELNGAPEGAFDPAFTAARQWLPEKNLEELPEGQVAVCVVPGNIQTTTTSRTTLQHEITVTVGIVKKLADEANATVDAMVDLAESVSKFLAFRKLASLAAASWISTDTDPICSPDYLRASRLFFGLLTLTYRVQEVLR